MDRQFVRRPRAARKFLRTCQRYTFTPCGPTRRGASCRVAGWLCTSYVIWRALCELRPRARSLRAPLAVAHDEAGTISVPDDEITLKSAIKRQARGNADYLRAIWTACNFFNSTTLIVDTAVARLSIIRKLGAIAPPGIRRMHIFSILGSDAIDVDVKMRKVQVALYVNSTIPSAIMNKRCAKQLASLCAIRSHEAQNKVGSEVQGFVRNSATKKKECSVLNLLRFFFFFFKAPLCAT